jgi:uncharacterized membrane protein YhaH (DUF805 family)
MNWYLDVLKNYAAFEGRAGREEFWHFTTLNILVSLALFSTNSHLLAFYALAVLIPSIAVSVRRLHDINRSGWWLLIAVVPILCIVVVIFLMQDGVAGQNQHGFNPKDVIA